MLKILLISIMLSCAISVQSQPVPGARNDNKKTEQTEKNSQYSDRSAPSLHLMQKEAKGTDKSAENSQDQSANPSRFSIQWWLTWLDKLIGDPIALFTLVLAVSTILLWRDTKTAANAARDAVKLARDEFIANHRPWLKIDVDKSSDFEYWNNGKASCTFKYTIKNVGGGPAHRVLISSEMFIGESGKAHLAQRKIADEMESSINRLGPTLFPDQTIEMNICHEASLDGLTSIVPTEDGTIMFLPEVIGVVGYDSTISNAQHHTGFHYQVYRGEVGHPNAKVFVRHLGNVPVHLIGLVRSLYGNSLAT